MFARRLIVALGAATLFTACADAPTATSAAPSSVALARAPLGQSSLLTSIPITLPNGTAALLSITSLALNSAGQLVASGTVTTAAGAVLGTFTNVVASLLNTQPGRCQILQLDLGPIFLDVLGLQVDLSAINLDIVAQSGPGQLLGNLLCAVANLLNNGGPLAGLTNLLNQINAILAGL